MFPDTDRIWEVGARFYKQNEEKIDFISIHGSETTLKKPKFSQEYVRHELDFWRLIVNDEAEKEGKSASYGLYDTEYKGIYDQEFKDPPAWLATAAIGVQGKAGAGLSGVGGCGMAMEYPETSNHGPYGYAGILLGASMGVSLTLQISYIRERRGELNGLVYGTYIGINAGPLPVNCSLMILTDWDYKVLMFSVGLGVGINVGKGVYGGGFLG